MKNNLMKKTTVSLKVTKQAPHVTSDHILSVYNLVKEFHEIFGHPIESGEITAEMLRLRANLIREEAKKEGLGAVNDANKVEILDAAGDTIYVLAGTLVMMGNSLSHALAFNKFESGISLKVSLRIGSDPLSDLKTAFEFCEGVVYDLDHIASLIEQNKGAKASDLLQVLPYAIADVIHLLNHIVAMCGVSMPDVVAAIHESNMSKLWSADIEERQRQVENCKYNPADLAFRPCLTRDGMIGYRISDDKILKSPSYTPVDLSSFADEWDV